MNQGMKVLLLVWMLLLGACATSPGTSAAAPDSQFESLLDDAQRHWRESDHDKAIAAYQQALYLQDRADVRAALGELLLETHRFAQAQIQFERLLSHDPDNLQLRENLALALLKQQEIQQAEHQFTMIHNRDASRARTLNYLGVISDLRGDFSAASDYYRQALAVDPDNAVFMNNFGYSRLMLREFDEAEYWFTRALNQDGVQAERVINNLSISYARQRRYDRAIKLLSTTGDDPVVLNNVGYIALVNGDYRQAIGYLERAMSLSPGYYARAAANLEEARGKLVAD